jgi:hypothetical protein
MIEVYIYMILSAAIGVAGGFFIGRNMGIQIGSELTFDLFVRLGYVKSHIDERGEIAIEKVSEGREPY